MNLPFKPHVLALICSAGLLAAAGTLYVKSRAPVEPAPAAPATVVAPVATPAPAAAPEVKTTYTPAQINQWVAPIALYPDALLSQVLMASTYPANVVQAVQWSKDHPSLQGDPAIQAVSDQPWDASVKSLVAFPPLMAMMGQDPVWVENLGNAFLAQPQDVMDAVQQLRALAQQTGTLKSTPQQTVTSVPKQSVAPASTSTTATTAQSTAHNSAPAPTVIKIEPTDPQVVYVPSYNPSTVYGTWPTPAYPPVYIPPSPGEEFTNSLVKGFGYSLGVATTYALFSNIDWDDDDHHHDDDYHHGDYNRNGDNNININVDNFNHITGQNLQGNTARWQHNPAYRNQVPYPTNTLANQFHQTNVPGGLSATQNTASRDSQRQAAMDKLSQGGIKVPTQSIGAVPKDAQRQAASKQLQQIAQRDNYRGYDTPRTTSQREASKRQVQQRLSNSTPEQHKERLQQQRSPEQRQQRHENVQQRRSTITPEQRQQRQENVHQRMAASNANLFSGNESRAPSWQQQAQRGQQSRNVVRNTNREAVRERVSEHREFHRR
ncbi:DUF3300 domain-containing protein [Pseudocitrobacter cyperus]|uniref:DUF3300 domain-containing protein n=1 Tax=Pseudocitrobacter cyperus TaxID=3112843 RepID=A0ABV0HI01_9ENTR